MARRDMMGQVQLHHHTEKRDCMTLGWSAIRSRVRWIRSLVCSLALCSFLFIVFWPNMAQKVIHLYHHWDCSNDESRAYINRLCENYTSGEVTGSLCAPLCSKDIHFHSCIGNHGMKLEVIKVDWGGKEMILKTFRPWGWESDNAVRLLKNGGTVTKSEFIKQANESLFNGMLGRTQSPLTYRVLDKMFSECDLHGDGILEFKELITCWGLVQTGEYIIYSLLNGSANIPALYGVCGNMFAVEYATVLTSDQYVGYESVLINRRPWKLRVELALALLDLVESLDSMPLGVLHMCDVKEANYGILRKKGKLIAKAIDLDSAWFGPHISTQKFDKIREGSCRRDSDCELLYCHVHCNTTTGKCMETVTSNNLQTLCERILRKLDKWKPSLLQGPPSGIGQQLDIILDKCVNPPPNSPPHIPADTLDQLRNVLESTIC